MITIGDKTVLYQTTLIVPDEEVASFDVLLEPTLRVELQFHPEVKSESRLMWRFGDNVLHIDFNGMDNPLGISPITPLKLGATNSGDALGFTFFLNRAGKMNRLDFLFLKGGQYA